MTSTDVTDGRDWLPGLGWLDMDPERVALIKGLYQLTAWVAEHRDLPEPQDQARVSPGLEGWQAECAVVDRVAGALGVTGEFRAGGGRYAAESWFGPVVVTSTAITADHMAAHVAAMSYADSVSPAVEPSDEATAGAR